MPAYDHAKHQHCRGVFDPHTYLELPVKQAAHRFHPALPPSTIWGYGGTFPGTTIDLRYNQPVFLRILNQLPAVGRHVGFGHPEIAPHLHNFHTASESDGGPWNWTAPGQPPRPPLLHGSRRILPARQDPCALASTRSPAATCARA